MGYTTDFTGKFNLNKPLTSGWSAYLKAFSQSRRMKRDASKTALLPDPVRDVVLLPVGDEGGYFVGNSENNFGQVHGSDVVDYNRPPAGQPGLWCQWTPTKDGQGIEWDGGEKFYDYVPWLEYLIVHFLAPNGYILNGEVDWRGEDSSDIGRIAVVNNAVTAKIGRVVYDE
jgi:hypothetical protein